MDLYFDACFKGRLICENGGGGVGRVSDSLTSSTAGHIPPLLRISTAYTGTGGIRLWGPSQPPASFWVLQPHAAPMAPISCALLFLPGFGSASWCFRFSHTVSHALHFSPSFSPFTPIFLCPKAPETRQTAGSPRRELFIEQVAASDGKVWLVTLESN